MDLGIEKKKMRKEITKRNVHFSNDLKFDPKKTERRQKNTERTEPNIDKKKLIPKIIFQCLGKNTHTHKQTINY